MQQSLPDIKQRYEWIKLELFTIAKGLTDLVLLSKSNNLQNSYSIFFLKT
jgi:hypothetical protein